MVGVLLAQGASLLFNIGSSVAVVMANKAVFTHGAFSFPTTLTLLHYLSSYLFIVALRACGSFEPRAVSADERPLEIATVFVWSLHNALSNFSLAANSVGMYQLSKLLVTPILCTFDFAAYGRCVSPLRGLTLLFAGVGVGLATVTDLQFHSAGAAAAMASALASSVLKLLQTHLLQRHGWTSLQLMHRTWLPQLALLALYAVPTDGLGLLSYSLSVPRALLLLLSCACGYLLNLSSLIALGTTSALTVVLLGQLKTCAILVVGFLLFDARPSARTVGGAALAVASIVLHTVLKIAEDRRRQAGDLSPQGAAAAVDGSEAPVERAALLRAIEARERDGEA